mmetsp:Transcript_39481/g.84232  ORF Transcript_39481/g.84232 Transcript_39481/m.84232 type:complete len:94 (+) Transcript_39481:1897-2178(+)
MERGSHIDEGVLDGEGDRLKADLREGVLSGNLLFHGGHCLTRKRTERYSSSGAMHNSNFSTGTLREQSCAGKYAGEEGRIQTWGMFMLKARMA